VSTNAISVIHVGGVGELLLMLSNTLQLLPLLRSPPTSQPPPPPVIVVVQQKQTHFMEYNPGLITGKTCA